MDEDMIILVEYISIKLNLLGRISGSHGDEYEDGYLLGCSAV
jgi:hypothetical protein